MDEKVGSGAVFCQTDVDLINAGGLGDFILVCEHASNVIPAEFSGLGLGAEERSSHSAWDIGAYQVALGLAKLLDAPLVAPCVSRLVYDCNRPRQAPSAIPERSENDDIPGNIGLSDAARRQRFERFYQPYRKVLVDTIDTAMAAGRKPAIVTIHSFTALFKGQKRDMDLGFLHDADARLAKAMFARNAASGDLTSCLNEPYGPADGVTYTLVEHALSRGLLNVMIEIRNDLIVHADTQQAMTKRLAHDLRDSFKEA